MALVFEPGREWGLAPWAPPNQTGQCQCWRRQNGPVRMYTRALLFKRCSRLAALNSILDTGRQPSLGGKGFAMADA
jgi:hypothetical protein